MTAGTLNGVLTAVLISTLVNQRSSLTKALSVGAVFAFLMSAIVFLAKGGWVSWDAPFVVPSGVVGGLILGPIVRRFNKPSS